jgi:hypothetical protein
VPSKPPVEVIFRICLVSSKSNNHFEKVTWLKREKRARKREALG